MARVPHPHKSDYAKNTAYANKICVILNVYKRERPNATFKEMADWYNEYARITPYPISKSSIARYYYGVHHFISTNWVNYPWPHRVRSHTRVRLGACCPITPLS